MLVYQFVDVEVLFSFEGWLEKILCRETLVMDSVYTCNFIKNTGVFLWILQTFQ